MIQDIGTPVRIGELVSGARRAGRIVWLVPAGATKSHCLAAFASVLGFPTWFGGNLDALADCLTDAVNDATADGGRVSLIWDGVRTLTDRDQDAYDGIRRVLGDVAGRRDDTDVTVVHRY